MGCVFMLNILGGGKVVGWGVFGLGYSLSFLNRLFYEFGWFFYRKWNIGKFKLDICIRYLLD